MQLQDSFCCVCVIIRAWSHLQAQREDKNVKCKSKQASHDSNWWIQLQNLVCRVCIIIGAWSHLQSQRKDKTALCCQLVFWKGHISGRNGCSGLPHFTPVAPASQLVSQVLLVFEHSDHLFLQSTAQHEQKGRLTSCMTPACSGQCFHLLAAMLDRTVLDM